MYVPVGPDIRISNATPSGIAERPSTAFSPDSKQYLTVFEYNARQQCVRRSEIYDRRVTETGGVLGSDLPISKAIGGTPSPTDGSAICPDVAYSTDSKEFLVVWSDRGAGDPGERDIFGRRVSSTGAALGPVFTISSTTDPGTDRDANNPAVSYNPSSQQFLVVWSGDEMAVDDEFVTMGRRVSTTGSTLGSFGSPFQISQNADLDQFTEPDVAYSPATNQYLVVWTGGMSSNWEIDGRRVDASGAPQGSDIQISDHYSVNPGRAPRTRGRGGWGGQFPGRLDRRPAR